MSESKKKKVVHKKKANSTGSAKEQGRRWADEKIKRKNSKQAKKNRIIRIAVIAVCVIAVLALVIVGAAYAMINHYYGLTKYVEDDSISTLDIEAASSLFDEDNDSYYEQKDITDEDGNVVGTTYETVDVDILTEDELASMEESVAADISAADEIQSSIAEEVEVATSDDVYNLLLVGVDLRAGSTWNGNSDSMILVSINNTKKTIYMTSFMRDLYANIPGVGTYKLNRAFATGGGPLLVQTIEENYRIDIDNYAWVDFYDMIDIIDCIGGLDIDVSTDEASVANMYIKEMCSGIGLDPNSYYISGGGTLHLNGMQTVAYARIRYVGNADFGRTQRQRDVLTKMFEKLKTMSVTDVNTFLNSVLPYITHNISTETVTNLLLSVPTYLTYDLVSQRVPYDGYYTYSGEMLVPDFEYTINMLHSTIY